MQTHRRMGEIETTHGLLQQPCWSGTFAGTVDVPTVFQGGGKNTVFVPSKQFPIHWNKLSWGSVGFSLCSSPSANLPLPLCIWSLLLSQNIRKKKAEVSWGQSCTERFEDQRRVQGEKGADFSNLHLLKIWWKKRSKNRIKLQQKPPFTAVR